jgi:hypothetical protein
MGDRLIGTAHVGRLRGVTRERVHQLRTENDDFPTPTVEHPRAAFWNESAGARWARLSQRRN